jgi:hypothetical protein
MSGVDHLRALPDTELAALLKLRPDLIVPVPTDLTALATRAHSRLSVGRALDTLDRFTLEILDGLRLVATTTADGTISVEALLGAIAPLPPDLEAESIRAAVDRLRALHLVYGTDPAALHLVGSLDDVCSPYPAGLGRPAAELDARAATVCAEAAQLRRELLAAPPAASAILERLAAGPPVGTLRAERNDSPVDWLIGHHLLVAISADAVELPREVAILLRRRSAESAGPLGMLHPKPPALNGTARPIATVDSAGAGQAMEAVRNVDELLAALGDEPPAALRSGGLGVRELRRLARAADLDEQTSAVLLEVAMSAALLAPVDGEPGNGPEPRFLPTARYDTWRALGLAQRWEELARAWLAMPREAALVGTRDDRERLISALAPEVERAYAPVRRGAAMSVLASAPAGTEIAPAGVQEQLAWRFPRRVGAVAEPTRWALAEAAMLGLTGLGALTSYGRLLLAEAAADAQRDPDADPLGVHATDALSPAVAALAALLPEPVDHVLLQADLTIVVPGPPAADLAAELSLVAEHESAGGARVYRLTPAGVRRALDAGWGAADLHAMFARRSKTPVPQALTYLIDDVARRHGGLRTGTAGCYLRSDDEALIGEVVADRRLATMGLRRLAPTVLISPYASARVLSALREAGYVPVAEDASGAAILTRARARRASNRPATRVAVSAVDSRAQLSAPRLAGIVDQIRRGDAAARAARRAPVSVRTASHAGPGAAQAHTQALAVLQQAVRGKQRVWVGYVDAHGATASRLVRPVSMGAGYLRAEDDRTETLHTFALHRITAAELA